MSILEKLTLTGNLILQHLALKAEKEHGHVGSDVKLTGYTKPSSTGAIATSDTVNQAVGKLEKGLDGKQATISDLATIRSDAAAGKAASDTIATYGSIVTYNEDDYATPDAVATAVSNHNTSTSSHSDMRGDITTIKSYIPTGTTSTNQLTTKDFVNSSVQTATANFRGNWATKAAIPSNAADYPADASGVKKPSTNDYLVVQNDETKNDETWRYKYIGSWDTDGKAGWTAEYRVNESPMTEAQLKAINSGITDDKVGAYDDHIANTDIHVTASDKTTWSGKQNALSTAQLNATNSGITSTKVGTYDSHVADTTVHVTAAEKAAWNGKMDPTTLAAVATSGDYNDLNNKPTIPVVTDTYSAVSSNAMSGKAVASAISGKANTSDLSTVATSGSYTDLSNKPTIPTVTDTYSATSSSAMSGKAVASAISNKMDKVTLATVATSGSYTDLSNKPTIPGVSDTYSATSSDAMSGKAVASAISGKQNSLSTTQLNATNSGITATKVSTYDGYASQIAGKMDKVTLATVATSGSYTDLSNKPTIPTVTDTYSSTSTSAMSGKAVASAISNKMDKVTLATVATSGSYNDLSNKPTIPSAVTESTVSGWGFTKNAGTITGITMNGSSKGTSGVVNLGTVLTAHQDISGKTDEATLETCLTNLATQLNNAS